MSIAGYDLILELSGEIIKQLAQESISSFAAFGDNDISSNSMTLPTDVWLMNFSLLGENADSESADNLHLIITDFSVEIGTDDNLLLRIEFAEGSIYLGSTEGILLSELGGEIELSTQLILADSGSSKFLQIDVPNSDVSLNLNEDSISAVNRLLNNNIFMIIIEEILGFRPTLNLLVGMVSNLLESRLQNGSEAITLTSFQTTTEAIGQLSPPVFTNIEVHTLENVGASNTLAILGNFIAERQGDITQYTSKVAAGKDFSIQISAEGLHKLVLCPAFSDALNKSLGADISATDMPEDCGNATELEVVSDLLMKSFLMNILPDQQLLSLYSELSYEVNSDEVKRIKIYLTIDISLGFQDNALTPSLDDVDVETDIKLTTWGKVLRVGAGILTLGLSELSIYSISEFAEGLADDLATKGLNLAFKDMRVELLDNFDGMPLVYESAVFHSDSLEMGGQLEGLTEMDLEVGVPSIVLYRKSRVLHDEITYSTLEIGEEEKICDHVKDSYQLTHHKVDYEYEIYVHDYKLLGRPISYEWRLAGINSPLDGSGSLILQTPDYPTPKTVEYVVEDDRLILRNEALDGEYSLTIALNATDVNGTVVSATYNLHVQPEWTDGYDDYDSDYWRCRMDSALAKLPKALAISEMRQNISKIRDGVQIPDILGPDPLPFEILEKDPLEYLGGVAMEQQGDTVVVMLQNGTTMAFDNSLDLRSVRTLRFSRTSMEKLTRSVKMG